MIGIVSLGIQVRDLFCLFTCAFQHDLSWFFDHFRHVYNAFWLSFPPTLLFPYCPLVLGHKNWDTLLSLWYVYVYVPMCMHAHMYACKCMCMCGCMCMCVHVFVYLCVHLYVHACVYVWVCVEMELFLWLKKVGSAVFLGTKHSHVIFLALLIPLLNLLASCSNHAN